LGRDKRIAKTKAAHLFICVAFKGKILKDENGSAPRGRKARPMDETIKFSQREKELRRQGWARQFVASEPRLSEVVELYEATGFEVHLEPVPPGAEIDLEDSDGCTACFDGFEDRYRVIYTRRKREGARRDDDLW